MDYKYSNKRKKDTNNDVPKMILKHKVDSDSVENINHQTQQIRLLSPHPNQVSFLLLIFLKNLY